MKQPKPKAEALDQMDAELIRETVQMKGWQLIRRGIQTVGDQKLRDLMRPHTEIETATLRGELSMIEAVLKLPEQLIEKAAMGRASDES